MWFFSKNKDDLSSEENKSDIKRKYLIIGGICIAIVLICAIVIFSIFKDNSKSERKLSGEIISTTATTEKAVTTVTTTKIVQQGKLSGNVLDEEGKVIPDADILISNKLTTRKYNCKSNKQGEFSIELPDGIYTVVANADGYEQVKIFDVQIADGKSVSLKGKIKLKPEINYEELYYDYVSNTLIDKYGLAAMNPFVMTNDGTYGAVEYIPYESFGLVSADIADYNNDDIPDMLTVVYGEAEEDYTWTLQLYTYNKKSKKIESSANYTFNSDKKNYYFFYNNAIQIEVSAGYVIVSSPYCYYEGTTTDYVVLSSDDLSEVVNFHYLAHGGYMLEINGEVIDYDITSENMTYEEFSDLYESAIANSVSEELNRIGLNYKEIDASDGLEITLDNSRMITYYSVDDEQKIITPGDKTNLREKLGIEYDTSVIYGPEIEPPTEPETEPVTESENEKILLETVEYDANGDGQNETIEVYEEGMLTTFHVISSDGSYNDYISYPGADNISTYYIVYDKNVGKSYIAFVQSGGGAMYQTFYIESEELGICVRAEVNNDGYGTEIERIYTINGEEVSRDDYINYISNIELLYSLYDGNIIEYGMNY